MERVTQNGGNPGCPGISCCGIGPRNFTSTNNMIRLRHFLLSLAGAAVLFTGSPASAQADAAALEAHPAGKVVREYLGMILGRQWNKSADIVDAASLKGLQEDYVMRLKGARTIDDEEAMTQRVGKATIEEVAKMTPREFYTAYHSGLQERYKVTDEVLETIRKSLDIRLLSIAEEEPKLVHVLVRTKHSNGKARVENLELISLRKNGEKWQVALNEQAPRAIPLDGSATAPGPAAPAAVDPVKKPAPTKPAPAGTKPSTTKPKVK